MKLIFFVFAIVSWMNNVYSHPVIYKDGIVLSSANMPSLSDNQIMYSFSQNWSTGLNHWRFSKDDKNTEFTFLKLNHLLYRYNGDSSQANIYLHGGFGLGDSEIEKRKKGEAYMAGAEADWETRTLYSALKYYYYTLPSATNIAMTQARIGFSPYKADFDQLQSWIMLQGMYSPILSNKVTVTPLLRFFYKNVLWEFGASTRGEWMLNLMVHY